MKRPAAMQQRQRSLTDLTREWTEIATTIQCLAHAETEIEKRALIAATDAMDVFHTRHPEVVHELIRSQPEVVETEVTVEIPLH